MLPVFVIDDISSSPHIVVEGDEAHHAIKVLRLAVDEKIILTDGKGNWVEASVSEIGKKNFTVDVLSRGFKEANSPELIVVQALTKSDRMRETIELLTVAGADRIIPWKAERSIAQMKEDSREKWELVAVAASKQSRRLRFPIIEEALTTKEVVQRFGPKVLVLHEVASQNLSSVKFLDGDSVVVVVGPEGGITDAELDALGGTAVRLGDEVLRSAHAGFAALSAIQALIGRW
jgi:16S rRNA (uracil1498-N3)-methyltransferase